MNSVEWNVWEGDERVVSFIFVNGTDLSEVKYGFPVHGGQDDGVFTRWVDVFEKVVYITKSEAFTKLFNVKRATVRGVGDGFVVLEWEEDDMIGESG